MNGLLEEDRSDILPESNGIDSLKTGTSKNSQPQVQFLLQPWTICRPPDPTGPEIQSLGEDTGEIPAVHKI